MEEIGNKINPNLESIRESSIYKNKNVSFIKTIIMGAFLVGASFWSGFELNILSYADKVNKSPDVILFILYTSLFLIFANLCIILISRRDALALMAFIASLSFIAGFIDNIFNTIVILSGIIMFVGFLLAINATRSYIDQSLKIKLFTAMNIALKNIIVAIAIIISIMFFSIFSSTSLSKNNPILPESAFESITMHVSNALYPMIGINFSQSLTDIARETIKKTEKSNDITLSKSQENILINKLISQYQNKINKTFDKTIDPNKKLSVSIYGLILNKFNHLDPYIRQIALAGLAFALFLSIQATAPILRIILLIILFVIYEILKTFGFFVIVYEQKSKEIIVLR